MSFADRVREELAEAEWKNPCCRQAMCKGLLIGAALDQSAHAVTVRYRHEVSASLAFSLLSQLYGKAPEQTVSASCGHRYYDLRMGTPALLRLMRSMEEGENADEIFRFSCEQCRAAFLRGTFLACGTVNDPHRSFHLEWKLPTPRRAELLTDVLSAVGYPPRSIKRSNCIGVYYKDSASVEELITLMGAYHSLFEVIDSRIERDIRNNENRATNCVARNIQKSVSAATRQIAAIDKLMSCGKLDALPEALRITAQQRYRNPDATLDELTALHQPPISKSGLNHRLQKLLELADELG